VKISRADDGPPQRRRQWRFYRTSSGNEPVLDFLTDRRLPDEDAAAIAAGMTEVRHMGREHRDGWCVRSRDSELDPQRALTPKWADCSCDY
jgi:hypothetical protein